MGFRVLVLSSLNMLILGQVVDSASAFAWVSQIGGLGIAAILALRTLPDAHREFRFAIDRNTEALHAIRLTMRGRRRRLRIIRLDPPAKPTA